jgi:hypothetical protein
MSRCIDTGQINACHLISGSCGVHGIAADVGNFLMANQIPDSLGFPCRSASPKTIRFFFLRSFVRFLKVP